MGAFLGAAITAILGKFVGMATFLIALALAAFAGFWLLGTDLGAWLFEQVLNIVILALNAIPFDGEMFNPGTYIDALPQEMRNILGLTRVGECLALIGTAIIIRLIMQLIPFTRLGS